MKVTSVSDVKKIRFVHVSISILMQYAISALPEEAKPLNALYRERINHDHTEQLRASPA